MSVSPSTNPPPGSHADPQADDGLVRATFESAPDGLVVIGSDGAILAYNRRFLQLWQFPPEMLARRHAAEMRQHTARQMRDPQAYLASLTGVDAVADADGPQTFDQVVLLDGRVFERHVAPLQAPGQPQGVVVRWRDITDRHRAEQALAQSQARLSALFEHALNAILLASDEGRYIGANPAACAMLGYTADELLALSVTDLVLPDTLSVDQYWAGFLQAGRSRGRVQLRRKDGAVIVAQFNAVAQMLPGANLSIMSDITDEVQAQARLQDLAHTDALTGISNRRHFMDLAVAALDRAARLGQPLALLMVDLDHFKAVNDRHGHAAGDRVLQAFVQMAAGVMRQGDLLGRVGGEEFAALLPQTDEAGATALAQRLVQGARDNPVTVDGQAIAFTVSIGLVVLRPPWQATPSIDTLMQAADQALYASKAGGRDRHSLAQPLPLGAGG